MSKIAFIGLGVMGRSMAKNLLAAGHSLTVYTRSREKVADYLRETGMDWRESIAACVADAEVVITMVGYPKDVEEVYFGQDGILAAARTGAVLIDMTTTDPALSQRIAAAARERGMAALDAPVSGGDSGARNATLSIMVGGDKASFDACLPVFQAMGKSILYEGPAGAGQHTKMANQIALAGALSGVCEALTYARRAGLDANTMLESIRKGAAGSWQMENLMPKMIAGDYAPGFFLKHFLKDMKIALSQEGELPVLAQVCAACQELEQAGDGDLGTQALIRYYQALGQNI